MTKGQNWKGVSFRSGKESLLDVAPHLMMPDRGCDYHPACLSCPLPICRYDTEGLAEAKRQRDEEIISLASQGWSVYLLTTRFQIGRRTLRTLLQRGRRALLSEGMVEDARN
jgi:hypothetical protein